MSRRPQKYDGGRGRAWLRATENSSFPLILCPNQRGPVGGIVIGDFPNRRYLDYVRRLIESDAGPKPWDR